MIRRIDTVDHTLFLTSIDAGPSTLSRHEREQEASAILVREAFGPEAKKAHRTDGSPFIAGHEEIPISISHSSSTCLLVVGKNCSRLGADIETPRGQLRRVRSRFLTPDEEARFTTLCSENEEMAFLLDCWTAKEAVYKAALTPGLGLTEISISTDFTHATARHRGYALTYHRLSADESVCVAVSAGGQLIS